MKIKSLIIIIVSMTLLIFPTIANASDAYTSTSTVNGVTAKWTYSLNETGKIEGLKCTNPTELTGKVTIPSELDGKTVISLGDNAFKGAVGITEITIPNSVTEIGYSAFDNCTKLKKITILDNVMSMGFYNVDDKDSIFKNDDKDLTIYCYKDSMAAKYAIKYNIKYVYLTKPAEENKGNENTKGKDDSTMASGKLPQTGINIGIIFIIVALIGGSIFGYKKYNEFKDI